MRFATSGLRCELSFGNRAAVETARLLRDYRGLDALRDSAMAVRQVRRGGIAVHCVSLDSRDTSWLRPIFGEDHLAVRRIEELPHRLPALFSRLLTGAR